MYTAKIVSHRNGVLNGNLRRFIKIDFLKDDVEHATIEIDVALYTPADQIKQLIRDRIEELQKGDLSEAALPAGQVVDLAGTVAVRTPEQEEKLQLGTQMSQLGNLQKLVDLGVVAADDKKITDLQAELATKVDKLI